jgi:hypothetical protein
MRDYPIGDPILDYDLILSSVLCYTPGSQPISRVTELDKPNISILVEELFFRGWFTRPCKANLWGNRNIIGGGDEQKGVPFVNSSQCTPLDKTVVSDRVY